MSFQFRRHLRTWPFDSSSCQKFRNYRAMHFLNRLGPLLKIRNVVTSDRIFRCVKKVPPHVFLEQNRRDDVLQKAMEECKKAGDMMKKVQESYTKTQKISVNPYLRRFVCDKGDWCNDPRVLKSEGYLLSKGKDEGSCKKTDNPCDKDLPKPVCQCPDDDSSDSCKKKQDSCKKDDSCKKKDDSCKKKDDSCKKKQDSCKKEDSCKKKDDSCKKKDDSCKKKDDSCKKKDDSCKKDECSNVREDVCKKKDSCKKEDSCNKKDTCKKKEDSCKKKEDHSKKKDSCKKKKDPSKDSCKKKKQDGECRKGKDDASKKKKYPCKKEDSAKKDPCKKKDSSKKKDSCQKKDPSKKKDSCTKKKDPSKKEQDPSKKKKDGECGKLKDDTSKKEDSGKNKGSPCKKSDSSDGKDVSGKTKKLCTRDPSKRRDPCKGKRVGPKTRRDPCRKKKDGPCKASSEKSCKSVSSKEKSSKDCRRYPVINEPGSDPVTKMTGAAGDFEVFDEVDVLDHEKLQVAEPYFKDHSYDAPFYSYAKYAYHDIIEFLTEKRMPQPSGKAKPETGK